MPNEAPLPPADPQAPEPSLPVADGAPAPEPGLSETFALLGQASRGFWLVNLVNFADGIAYFGILGLLTLFLSQDVGLSDVATGRAVSNFTGLVTLTMFVGGYVSDRLGVRRALGWSLLAIGLGRLLLTLAPQAGTAVVSLPWLSLGLSGVGYAPLALEMRVLVAYVALFVMAVASGIMQPALYAGTKEYTDDKTSAIGYGLLYSIMNLGIFFESLLSPYVRVTLGKGISGVFWMCTAMTLGTSLVHALLFTRSVEESQRIANPTPEPAAAEPSLTWLERAKRLPLFDPRFSFFIFILLPVRTLFAHQWLTMPDYVMREFPKVVQDRFEWLNGINPLIIVFAVPLVTAYARRARTVDMMIVGTAVTALTTFILVPGPGLERLLVYLVLFSVGEALWSSRFFEYVAELAPPGQVGAYMGLAGIPWFLAKWTTGQYSGAMLERYIPKDGVHHSGDMWLIYGLIACISPVGLILARRWIIAKTEPASP